MNFEEVKFSVLLSVYKKENPEFLNEAIESIYFNQNLKPDEIVLVEDGELTEELVTVIESLKKRLGSVLKIVSLEKNMGLGNALQRGILECSYELVARMDTDDIAYPERFEKQIEYFKQNPETDVLGTYMTEFVNNIENVVCIKDAPIDGIKEYMKHRSPLNHPSVMFKKSKVLEAGNYIEISLNEDTYLWARMLAKGCIIRNLPESLMYFRTTDDTYQRRGGLRYVKSEIEIQKQLLKLKLINIPTFVFNVITKSIVMMMPNKLRKWVYLHVLRKD